MKVRLQNLKIHSKPIVAGILIGTSYIPFPPWASLFCFVPLWLRFLELEKENASWKKVFFAGWITQFILTLIGFNWVALTVHEFGHMPWPVAILALIAFCCFANLDVALAGAFWHLTSKKLKLPAHLKILTLPLWTAIFESWVSTIFSWNYGYSWLASGAPIAQVSELVGFQGLSSIVILLNLGALLWWQNRKNFKPLILVAIIFISLNVAGLVLKKTVSTPDQKINVLITQANIGNLEKQYAEKGWGFREHIFERYSSLSQSAIEAAPDTRVDFMVWPETAYPYDMDQRLWSSRDIYPPGARNLIQMTQKLKTNLITGGYGYSPADGKLTNTFFIFENEKVQPNPYYKTILLAFGEYIPGAKTFPILKKWIPAGDFSRGPGAQVQKINGITIGPQICYESLFPYFTKKLADDGAQIIVNLTNDSWYGTWQEPYQHLYMTLARAIEFRRPLIRATNTGISTVVLANGDVLERSPLASEWTHIFTIPFQSKPEATFYQLCPWLIDGILIFTLLLAFFVSRMRNQLKPT